MENSANGIFCALRRMVVLIVLGMEVFGASAAWNGNKTEADNFATKSISVTV